MSKKIILFEGEQLYFEKKFYILIDLLISNQSNSRFESFLLFTIFYLQIISSFFSDKLNAFSPNNAKSDKFLYYIHKILRVKELLINNYLVFQIFGFILFILIIVLIIHFLLSIIIITKTSFYSYNKKIINIYIKIFLYIAYNIIYDICFCSFSLNEGDINNNFPSIKISNKHIIIVSIINFLISLSIYIFFNIYYNDSFYLSKSYYAKMSCNYDTFWGINCLIMSFLLAQIKSFTKELFLIYNLIISVR